VRHRRGGGKPAYPAIDANGPAPTGVGTVTGAGGVSAVAAPRRHTCPTEFAATTVAPLAPSATAPAGTARPTSRPPLIVAARCPGTLTNGDAPAKDTDAPAGMDTEPTVWSPSMPHQSSPSLVRAATT